MEARESAAETTPAPVVEPQKEHHWLQKFVGDWVFEGEASLGPEGPKERFNGTESVRSIGGIWILAEGQSDGQVETPYINIFTLGYNPDKGRFVGSFIASMMTHLWVYDGELDRNQTTLTLNTEGPTMSAEPGTAQFREVIEFVNDDHRTWTSFVQDADGSWHELMKSDYRRRR